MLGCWQAGFTTTEKTNKKGGLIIAGGNIEMWGYQSKLQTLCTRKQKPYKWHDLGCYRWMVLFSIQMYKK